MKWYVPSGSRILIDGRYAYVTWSDTRTPGGSIDGIMARVPLALYQGDGKRSRIDYVRSLDYPLLGKSVHVTDEVDISLVKPRPRRYETAGAASAAAKGPEAPKDKA